MRRTPFHVFTRARTTGGQPAATQASGFSDELAALAAEVLASIAWAF